MEWKSKLVPIVWTIWAISLAWFALWLYLDFSDVLSRPNLYAYGGFVLIAATIMLVWRSRSEVTKYKTQLFDKERLETLRDQFSMRLKEGEDLQRRNIPDDRDQYLIWKAEYQNWFETVYAELEEKRSKSDAVDFYTMSDLPAPKEFRDHEHYQGDDYNNDLNVLDRYLVTISKHSIAGTRVRRRPTG